MNLPTILISIVVFGTAIAIVVWEIVKRKKGKSSCGGNCAGCAFSGSCHTQNKER